MEQGYCFMCDAPAADDPCPGCGRPLSRPESNPHRSVDQPHRDPLLTPDETKGPVRRRSLVWVAGLGVVLLVVILAVLRSSFGV